MAPTRSELDLPARVCLALVCDGHRHGWSIASELAPDGPLGRIWSLSRALTYRALDRLLADGLLTSPGTEPGRGRERRLLEATAAGRRAVARWLDTPVEHLRDVRTELLLKLELRARAELPLDVFLDAQRAALAPIVERLEGADTAGDPVALWRREQARAARRFLDALASAPPRAGTDTHGDAAGETGHDHGGLQLSARNQLEATITGIALGDQVATVAARVGAGEVVSAVITRTALDDLALVEGDRVLMISKAADTVVGVRRPRA